MTGIQTYTITYKVERAINYFNDHDELYWNAIGTNWDVPIYNAQVDVILPEGIKESDIRKSCLAGPSGSVIGCDALTTANSASYFAQAQLMPHEGFTVVVGWPVGIVKKPGLASVIVGFLRDNIGFLIPFLVLVIMLFVWNSYGRDPVSKLPVAAQYEPPEGLTPIEAGFLLDEKNQSQEITAEIIYLATLGFLKIERIPKKGWFGKDDFKLIKLKDEKDLPHAFDRNLLRTLFSMGPSEVLLSSLSKKYKLTRENFAPHTVSNAMVKAGYYDRDPLKIRTWYTGVAGALIFFLFYFFLEVVSLWGFIIPVIISLAIIWVIGYFMPKRTQKGADARQLVLGLKEYLSVAEKDRLDFHNDPQKDPKVFEKLLPYAIALGVSKQWAKKFEGLFDFHPSWFIDPTRSSFNPILFNSSISGFSSGFRTMVLEADKSAAGAGRSGFGGGGFSGGGFGGGGGGRW